MNLPCLYILYVSPAMQHSDKIAHISFLNGPEIDQIQWCFSDKNIRFEANIVQWASIPEPLRSKGRPYVRYVRCFSDKVRRVRYACVILP